MPLRIFLMLLSAVRGVPVLHRASWQVRKQYNRTKRALRVRRPVVDAAPHLREAIERGLPYAAGKMGSVETLGLYVYLQRRKARAAHRPLPAYSPYQRHTLFTNAGVFPQTDDGFDAFGATYLEAVKQCDMLVAWDVAGEAAILSEEATRATLVHFRTLEPFFAKQPWSAALAGRRVLVISPFADSISKQYGKRETLWENPAMLPAFTLLTLKPPLSAGLVPPQDADWNAAVARMQREMDALAYDVALIGAGAFSLPLAAHAKARGRIGIHLGGGLQMLFGVAGERWKRDKDYRHLIGQNWTRPGEAETPKTVNAVEKGCYW